MEIRIRDGMQKKLTTQQVMFTGSLSIISTSLVIKHLFTILKSDAWMAVIAGYLLSLLIFLLYSVLAKKFPNKTIVEINESVFGSIIGRLCSALYIFYIFTIACLNTHIISNFIKAFTLPNTPIALILLLFISICVWAVRKGPVNLMKYSALFAYGSIAIILINSLFLYKDIDIKNLQPSLSLPVEKYLIGTHTITMLPMCDLFILMMFLPDMHKPKEFGKAISRGLSIGAAILLFVVIRDITVLGGEITITSFPTLTTIRKIDIADILTRMDIFYILLLLSLMFYKVSMLFTACITGVQRLMRFDSYRFLVRSFGALLLIYTLIVFRATSEHLEFLHNGAAVFFQTFFLFMLPLVTLITAVCRSSFRKARAGA